MDRFRAESYDYRSKFEVLQEEYTSFVEAQAKEAESNQTLLKATRDGLQRTIDELQRRVDAHAMDDTPRQLNRLKTQLEISERQWADENQQVRLTAYYLV